LFSQHFSRPLSVFSYVSLYRAAMSSRGTDSSPLLPDSGSGESCLQAALDGSREAQAELLEAVRPYLLSVAQDELASDIRPKLAASDVVQIAVLQAWQNFGDFRGKTRAELIGWLQTILINCAANGARRYRKIAKRDVRREQSLEQMASEFGGALADSANSPSINMMASEERQRMELVLGRLSPKNEQTIRLRNDLGLSFVEMGVALSCSASAASKQWARAVKALGRELLRDETDQL
jgi:RNA polymerase sigma-70 factor (subfamily 1)